MRMAYVRPIARSHRRSPSRTLEPRWLVAATEKRHTACAASVRTEDAGRIIPEDAPRMPRGISSVINDHGGLGLSPGCLTVGVQSGAVNSTVRLRRQPFYWPPDHRAFMQISGL